MIIDISVAIAVLIFAILTAFIIQTLCALRHTLLGIDRLNVEISEKLNRLDPTLQAISNLGEISKFETDKIKIAYLIKQNELGKAHNPSNDLAEWLVASVKLGSKMFLRRQSHESE
jgi:ATP-dependent exoDNAse (exonuclease V) alpha subunit